VRKSAHNRAVALWSRGLHTAAALQSDLPELCEIISVCPLCNGTMELVYDRPTTKVCVCVDCHLSITVPARAWEVALERGTVKPKPRRRSTDWPHGQRPAYRSGT